MIKNRKIYIKGVSVIEYSLIVAVAAAALLGMSIYVKRAISGRWRQAADTFGYARQYDAKELNIFGVGGIGGVGGGIGGVGGGPIGGSGGIGGVATPSPVYHSGGGWSNLAAKGKSGAQIDPGLQSAMDLLKNSKSASYAYDLIQDKKIRVKFADLEEGIGALWDAGENTIVVNSSHKDSPASLLAGLIAHEATHADYTYYPDFWINTTLTRHPELTREQINIPGNSVNQEYDAFVNGVVAWKELGGDSGGWSGVYEQGEEFMRATIKAVYTAMGQDLPDY